MLLSWSNAAKGEPVLPTLGFILCAYGIYALYRAWSRRHRRLAHPYRQWQKKRRLTLVGGTGVGLGIIILIAILGLPSQYDDLTSANIISTSWGYDSLKPGQVMPRQEILPPKTQGDLGHPVYAYLHPETPPAQLLAEKNAPPARPGKGQRLRKPLTRGHALKVSAHPPTKDKAPGKHQVKNNKTKKKKAPPLNKTLVANFH